MPSWSFGLTGELGYAVIDILEDAAFEFEEGGEDVGNRIIRALDYVNAEIEREATHVAP